MNADTKQTVGCLGGIVAVFFIVGLLAELGSKPLPPMSDAEFASKLATIRAERRQHCIDTLRKSIPLMPKDARQYAYAAMAKCGDDGD
jgi:hypothetical protein